MSIEPVATPLQPHFFIRTFLKFTIKEGMFEILSRWLELRNGWTPERVRRLELNTVTLCNPDRDRESICYRMLLEAVKVRDLNLFVSIPRIKERVHLRDEIAEFLIDDLLAHPDDEPLFQMMTYYFSTNRVELFRLTSLFEKAVKNTEVALMRKLLNTFPQITLKMRRNWLHDPHDKSSTTRDPEKLKAYRDMIALLDPTFELPPRLRNLLTNCAVSPIVLPPNS